MAEHRSPGIYFEENRRPATQVVGVPASVAAFSGQAQKGPLNVPVRLTSFGEYTDIFGDYVSGAWLAHAVRQFFEQGGAACFANRLAHYTDLPNGVTDAVRATLQLQNTTPTNNVLLQASSHGSWGNELSVKAARIDTVIAAVAVNIGVGATTEAQLSDIRRIHIGATINMAQGGNNLRVVVTRVDEAQKKIFFASTAPTGAVNATGSTVTLEEWDLLIYRNGSFRERIAGMSMSSTAGARYFRTMVSNNDPRRDVYVQTDNALALSNTVDNRPATSAAFLPFISGANGSSIVDADVVGNSSSSTGFFAYDTNTEATLLAAPGFTTATVHQALISYCENRFQASPMFFIAAVPSGQTPTQAATYKNSTANLYTEHGAIYYPWITQTDPSTGVLTTMPPEGCVAGVYARVARSRGVQRAPAGTVEGRLVAVLGIERIVSQGDQDVLNPIGINVIRQFDNRGICVFGARTLAIGDFLYVPVRRVFNYVRASLARSLDAFVFEENDEITRAGMKRACDTFLLNEWRKRLLKGSTAEAAFYVICDESNNPESVQSAGQLVVDIGLAVANPAEFIIFRLTRDQRALDAELAAAGLA